MSVWRIANYAVWICIPFKEMQILLVVARRNRKQRRGLGERRENRHFGLLASLAESEAKKGGVAPASLPLFESGTSRILSEWSKIQRACHLEGGSLRVYLPRKAVRIVRREKPGDWLWCLVYLG